MYKPGTKEQEFHQKLGSLFKEMRTKRNKKQEDFEIPVRTIRRIEKGEAQHSASMEYFRELNPCLKETVLWLRLAFEVVEPRCALCDTNCQLCGKEFVEVVNAIRTQLGMTER